LQGEGNSGKEAVKHAVNILRQALYNPRVRQRLLSDAPIIIFVLEYVEHGERWKAGVRIRKSYWR